MERKLKKKSELSVILRTKNEETWIGHAIQSILDNLYKPEIIIIDNNSTDQTLDIVRHFIQEPHLEKTVSKYTDIKIFKIDNYSPGKSLNLGIKKSTKKFIMIMSAHCILKKVNYFKHTKDLKKYAGIFGKQNPIWNGKKITKRYIWSHFEDKEIPNMFSKLENRYFFHNAISIFEKKKLIKYPFHEKLAGKEDRYWANRIRKKKLNYLYDPSIEVDHQYTENGNTWKGIG
tara:strand:- start:3039 stop:3731 length:693 start_codon:yes stop_codon:yes gene_type:complete